MPAHSAAKAPGRKSLSASLAAFLLIAVPAFGQGQGIEVAAPTTTSFKHCCVSTHVPATQESSTKGGHPAETNPGRTPHGSSDGAAIAAGVGAAATAVIVGEMVAHHMSPKKLGQQGPQVPKELSMNDFVIKGLVRAAWPIALDFMIDSPGFAQVDITAGERTFLVRMHNEANQRGIAKVRLPRYFGTKLRIATYKIRSMPVAGSSDPAPKLRVYGLGAGEKAVGSVAIDQLTFQPATIHPKAKEVADYGFHAHSAFDSVKAGFIFTTLHEGHVLVQKDQEEELSPVPEGERAKGTWKGDPGRAGEHMLQIRAWRGLKSGGDWVVAWSPDIVDVVK